MAIVISPSVSVTAPGAAVNMWNQVIALLVAQGWTIPASSTGTGGTYNASGDAGAFFALATASGGMLGWKRIKQPGSTREILIQRDNSQTTDPNFRIKYSLAGFSGGSPSLNQVPSASDENIILGGGTDVSPTFTNFTPQTVGTFKFHAWVQSAAPYGFAFRSYQQSLSTTQGVCMVLDPLTGCDATDQDPYALLICEPATNTALQAASMGAATSPGAANGGRVMTWYKYGLSGAIFQSIAALALVDCNSSGNIAPGGLAANAFDAKDDIFPIAYARPASKSGLGGFKGFSTLLRWKGSSRTQNDTLSVTTSKDRIICGDCVLVWDGSVPALWPTSLRKIRPS